MATHLAAIDAVTAQTSPFVGLGIVVLNAEGQQSSAHAIAQGHSRRSATIAGMALALDAAAPALKAGDHIELLTVLDGRNLLGSIDRDDPLMAQSAELLETALQELTSRGVAIAISRAMGSESKSLSEATRQAALAILAGNHAVPA